MYQTILVPTDFSKPAECAWEHAVALAKVHGSKLVVLYVVEPLLSHYGIVGLLPGVKELEDRHDIDTRLQLKELVASAQEQGLSVSYQTRVGKPWKVVVETVAKEGADLVVMGTHGRSGVVLDSIGSTAERVVRTTPCPVMVIRSRPEG